MASLNDFVERDTITVKKFLKESEISEGLDLSLSLIDSIFDGQVDDQEELKAQPLTEPATHINNFLYSSESAFFFSDKDIKTLRDYYIGKMNESITDDESGLKILANVSDFFQLLEIFIFYFSVETISNEELKFYFEFI